MLNKQGLNALFDLEGKADGPRILIYAHQISPRLEHVCHFIFQVVLKLNYRITDQINEFNTWGEAKINYSSEEITGSLHIHPNALLSETGIQETKPEAFLKNDFLYFYPNKSSHTSESLHFDIFSAVFYFISRYEEWQPYAKDQHQRFEAAESILYKNNFHLVPVVDRWIQELKLRLLAHYPKFNFPQKQFKIISSIDVDNLFAYQSKGALRTLGAMAKDVLKFDFENLKERLNVIRGKNADPFDIYEEISDFCFELKIPLIYFFLFTTGTKFDRTVDPASGAFDKVFKILKKNRALMGIHPSYYSSQNKTLLEKEIRHFSTRTETKTVLSRQHYLRFDIRSTPELLLQNGILADFSMGFASTPGFRAGTSQPFYYYDLKEEKSKDLLFVPFCAMDGAYTVYEKIDPQTAYKSMLELANEVKKVEGLFISVYHERSFSNHLYPGFGTLYKNLHQKLKEL